MKRLRLIFAAFLLVLQLGCKDNSSSPPQNVCALRLSPAQSEITIGEEITLTIEAGDFDQPIFALSIRIAYDSAAVDFLAAQLPAQTGFFTDSAICFAQSGSDVIYLTVTQIQGQPEVSGSGSIAELTFRGISTGSSSLEIVSDELHFFNSAGVEIQIMQIEIGSAVITVSNP